MMSEVVRVVIAVVSGWSLYWNCLGEVLREIRWGEFVWGDEVLDSLGGVRLGEFAWGN